MSVPEPSLPLAVVHGMAAVRTLAREGTPPQLTTTLHLLLESVGIIAGALVSTRVAGPTERDVVRTALESVTGGVSRGAIGTKVSDVWIKPKDAAAILGYSEKWLRRRRSKPPYSAFCIPIERGRYRVSRRALEEHMERERRRAARE